MSAFTWHHEIQRESKTIVYLHNGAQDHDSVVATSMIGPKVLNQAKGSSRWINSIARDSDCFVWRTN